MTVFGRILVPVDFSETSDVALTYGKALAGKFSASLHVVHVLDDSLLMPYASAAFEGPLLALRDEIEQDCRTRLADVFAEEERLLDVTTALRRGQAFAEILRYAADERIDLIVMGTHGRGPVSHMLLGSVAEKVVRGGPCPVLTVRHPEHEFVMP